MDDHEDEWARIMGGPRQSSDLTRLMFVGELRLWGCLTVLLAVLLLTGLAWQWVGRH
ncbi:hypothetical protein [Micromonospora sp. NPDC005806]|uniref:hypothetical protein n=1 Tax=Micromonospora sp. NPDC005806 TaxID=3364234 RepID=UPI00368919D0